MALSAPASAQWYPQQQPQGKRQKDNAVLAGMVWALENPEKGIVDAIRTRRVEPVAAVEAVEGAETMSLHRRDFLDIRKADPSIEPSHHTIRLVNASATRVVSPSVRLRKPRRRTWP